MKIFCMEIKQIMVLSSDNNDMAKTMMEPFLGVPNYYQYGILSFTDFQYRCCLEKTITFTI